MFTSSHLKAIITEARPIIERQLDDAELIAGIRTKVTNDGGDWGQVRALLKAMIQDERDETGDSKRVAALLGKAEHATAYANMLGLGNLNEKNSFAAVSAGASTSRSRPSGDGVESGQSSQQGRGYSDHAQSGGPTQATSSGFSDPGVAADGEGAAPGSLANKIEPSGNSGELESAPILSQGEREADALDLEASADQSQESLGASDTAVRTGDAVAGAVNGAENVSPQNVTAGETAPYPTAADNARKIRPWCLHADDLNKCGGYGRVHCHTCLKAHADAEGLAA